MKSSLTFLLLALTASFAVLPLYAWNPSAATSRGSHSAGLVSDVVDVFGLGKRASASKTIRHDVDHASNEAVSEKADEEEGHERGSGYNEDGPDPDKLAWYGASAVTSP